MIITTVESRVRCSWCLCRIFGFSPGVCLVLSCGLVTHLDFEWL